MIEETHPFDLFIPNEAKKLVIGSFPCFNGIDYGEWFYCGSNKNYFWQLLSDIYTMPIQNLEDKIRICQDHGIALTDVALKIKREQGNCSDANLKIIQYNDINIKKCLDSSIDMILFTSRYVEKHFKAIFPNFANQTVVIPSPSPAANRHIAGLKEYKEMKSAGLLATVYDYRLLKYKQVFN